MCIIVYFLNHRSRQRGLHGIPKEIQNAPKVITTPEPSSHTTAAVAAAATTLYEDLDLYSYSLYRKPSNERPLLESTCEKGREQPAHYQNGVCESYPRDNSLRCVYDGREDRNRLGSERRSLTTDPADDYGYVDPSVNEEHFYVPMKEIST